MYATIRFRALDFFTSPHLTFFERPLENDFLPVRQGVGGKWARMSFEQPHPAMSREADTKKFESPENFSKVFRPPEAETLSEFNEEPV